jgi:hypothetical protein
MADKRDPPRLIGFFQDFTSRKPTIGPA